MASATRGICADCEHYVELINDACKPCLEQRRLVSCERGLLDARTDEERVMWGDFYRAIVERNAPR